MERQVAPAAVGPLTLPEMHLSVCVQNPHLRLAGALSHLPHVPLYALQGS
jgi:hypothetical protein